jgi:photosystem II stability/assembly factor-like uncharacterized protein
MIVRTLPAIALLILSNFICGQAAQAQSNGSKNLLSPTDVTQRMNVKKQVQNARENSWTAGLPLRNVGPTVMSGRVADVALAAEDGSAFFVAYASGGLWFTENHGTSFEPLFDDALSITLGAVAYHTASKRIWLGTGEVNSSRSSYAGTGVYASDDLGETWKHIGLPETQHIGRIVLDPENAAVAYVAALGPLYSKNESGGVYRTINGGEDWEKTLDVQGMHGTAGAVDLIMDPNNAQHLFAATWDRTRRAWDFQGNGTGSAVWESMDGGTTWRDLSAMNGFPKSEFTGRIGLSWQADSMELFALVDNQTPQAAENADAKGYKADTFIGMSAKNFSKLDTVLLEDFLAENNFPLDITAAQVFERVQNDELQPQALHDFLTDGNKALFEAEIVGAEVYRINPSTDAAWERTHAEPLENVCYTYGYYFGLIEVDATDPDHLWIAGVPLLESNDGGNNWQSIGAENVHVDHHFLWSNPLNPEHLINGNDGGINISWDGGAHWIKCNSPAVGQFYAIEVDNATPYNIYGGLQDNGSWVGSSRYQASPGWQQSGQYNWKMIGGGDGMQIEVDPRDPAVVFSGSQFGWYSRQDRNTQEYTSLHPQHQLGETPLRWNWQTPIWLSRHQPDILYMASNRVHRSFDQGREWETLSRDLTRGGIPGNVPFGTITSMHESPLRFGQLAIGTDDGLIQISRDGGYSWSNLTSPVPQNPKKKQMLWVSEVLWSHHAKDRLYVALNGYRLDHFESYVFVTENDGRSWDRIGSSAEAGGIPGEPVNALMESATHSDLLFAGTDGGAYASLDAGETWNVLHPDLPQVPVHDIAIQERENELVIGTHGRSIWVLDIDLLLSEWNPNEKWADSAPRLLALDTLVEVTWNENWGERGWSWSEPAEINALVTCFSPMQTAGIWLAEDSSGQRLQLSDSVFIQKGWQTAEVPLRISGSSDYLGLGEYQLIWQGASGERKTRLSIQAKEEKEEEK